jgi:hypothetical protein
LGEALNAQSTQGQLAERIHELIAKGTDADFSAFDDLSLDVFRYQFEHNLAYREYCLARGVQAESVSDWRDIPAYPTAAFKRDIVVSFPMEQAVMAQLTSGTTEANQRGRIFRDEVGRELVFSANRAMTAAYLFPDLESGCRCRILILAPSPQMAPSMGMAIGMEQTRTAFGTDDSRFLLEKTGLDIPTLVEALRTAENTGVCVAMIGSTSAFVYFLRACKRQHLTFRLPAGSRLADGGGYRGRFGEMTRDNYYALVEEVLGVPASSCVNTLGMAESATNYFDNTLREAMLGHPDATRCKRAPAWTRVRAVDVETLEPLPHGAVGLLQHFDLANLPTVIGVQSDNLGYTVDDCCFEIVGRAKIENGAVSTMPSERVVGPMGDRPIFRFLENYVNFSIDFKMGLYRRKQGHPRHEVESAGDKALPSCPTVVDEIVAGADDPVARARAEKALKTYGANG